MAPKIRQRLNSFASTGRENQSSSTNSRQSEATISRDGSSRYTSSSSIGHRQEGKPIVINGGDAFNSVAFLDDGKQIVSGGDDSKIRRWRVEDGREVRGPMTAKDPVWGIGVSRDGQWIVSGTMGGLVTVWNAKTHEKATEFKGHGGEVRAVDVSPDGVRIVTGSDDKTVCIWSLSTGERLLGPLKQAGYVVGAKFSPNGSLIAIATLASVRVYDNLGDRLVDTQLKVNSWFNTCFAWASDGKQLYTLSGDGHVHCFNVSTGLTLSKWRIHSTLDVRCIAIAVNDTLIIASAGESVSLWDTSTRGRIGTIAKLPHPIWSMAISNWDLVAAGERWISLQNLRDILPSSYPINVSVLTSSSSSITHSEENVEGLRDELAKLQRTTEEQNEIIRPLRSDLNSQEMNSKHLERTVKELRDQLSASQRSADKERDRLNGVVDSLHANLRAREESENGLNETIRSLREDIRARETSFNDAVAILEQTKRDLLAELVECQQKADTLMRINRAHEEMHQCESLFVQGRIHDAAQSLLEMVNTTSQDVWTDQLVRSWLPEFTDRCIETLERIGDQASSTGKRNEAVAAYSNILSLSSSNPDVMLKKWASAVLNDGSPQDALSTARRFCHPISAVYRAICDTLEEGRRLSEAIKCFRQMRAELPDYAATHDEHAQWERDFRGHCTQKLEKLGDAARDSRRHNEAIGYYLDILELDPTNLNILLKHSDETIEVNPSSYKGYKGKHAALHGMRRYSEAFGAFRTMLSKIEQSTDGNIRKLRSQYVDATSTIQKEVNKAIRDLPTVLIDTETGRLYDKAQQAEAFKELPVFDELRSSMAMQFDFSRIRMEVIKFYQYVMLSHRWQPHEPTFQQVENTSVYKLPLSPTFSKLQSFCKLACSLRFKWAWSDTVCVNQFDRGVQQESVVAMFRWYHGSSLTIVHLLGVLDDAREIGRLRRSIWNTRGWTYQEYIASRIVQFYTEDWKPYLGLQIFNHKESPDILLEMEQAMNFTTEQLITLDPGLDRVREKLYLASMRHTTRVEDMAYSLFGIFKVALPVIYGEGIQAVSRLLEHILMRSGDVTLLAWTGNPGSHHSYLPVDLTVYNQILPPHLPPPLEPAEMEGMLTALYSSPSELSLITDLYNRLYDLPTLSLVAGRLRLPGIVFPLDDLVLSGSIPDPDPPVHRATTPMLGNIEIETKDDLLGTEGLVLFHPWISSLLDQDFSRGITRFSLATRALRLVVRLRQPFGALLFAPSAREQYRRVATDSLIMVRVREDVSFTELMGGIRTLDIQ